MIMKAVIYGKEIEVKCPYCGEDRAEYLVVTDDYPNDPRKEYPFKMVICKKDHHGTKDPGFFVRISDGKCLTFRDVAELIDE